MSDTDSDAAAFPDDPVQWVRDHLDDVFLVETTTARYATSVYYDVSVGLRSLAATSFERGENMRTIWAREVEFAQTVGDTFEGTAREQNRIATTIGALLRGTP